MQNYQLQKYITIWTSLTRKMFVKTIDVSPSIRHLSNSSLGDAQLLIVFIVLHCENKSKINVRIRQALNRRLVDDSRLRFMCQISFASNAVRSTFGPDPLSTSTSWVVSVSMVDLLLSVARGHVSVANVPYDAWLSYCDSNPFRSFVVRSRLIRLMWQSSLQLLIWSSVDVP